MNSERQREIERDRERQRETVRNSGPMMDWLNPSQDKQLKRNPDSVEFDSLPIGYQCDESANRSTNVMGLPIGLPMTWVFQ